MPGAPFFSFLNSFLFLRRVFGLSHLCRPVSVLLRRGFHKRHPFPSVNFPEPCRGSVSYGFSDRVSAHVCRIENPDASR